MLHFALKDAFTCDRTSIWFLIYPLQNDTSRLMPRFRNDRTDSDMFRFFEFWDAKYPSAL